MTVDRVHAWARVAAGEAAHAMTLADEILAATDPAAMKAPSVELVESASQLRRDAGNLHHAVVEQVDG